jgi:hypothetical protein
MGRIGRLIFEETSFETCFGCAKDEEICPVNIPISELMTEGVNKVSVTTKPSIEISDVEADIRALEMKLNESIGIDLYSSYLWGVLLNMILLV